MLWLVIALLKVLVSLALLFLVSRWLWLKGRNGRVAACALVWAVAGLCFVSYFHWHASSEGDEATRATLDSGLRTAVAVGDGTEKIERVLKEKQLSYDRLGDVGYSCSIPTIDHNGHIVVTIMLGRTHKLETIEVVRMYRE